MRWSCARLLGSLDLRIGDRQVPALKSGRPESLLAFLLLHADAAQPHSSRQTARGEGTLSSKRLPATELERTPDPQGGTELVAEHTEAIGTLVHEAGETHQFDARPIEDHFSAVG
jgi:hypothetical protein